MITNRFSPKSAAEFLSFEVRWSNRIWYTKFSCIFYSTWFRIYTVKLQMKGIDTK